MNSIEMPFPLERICWFCESKCISYISICTTCEYKIKKKKNDKKIKN